jgi:serine/threonine protein kinase/TolB-like protein/tetratricopeptide (TPR) repeat protein
MRRGAPQFGKGDRVRFEAGSSFAGYTVVSRLGRGGMASVYLVREHGIDRLVALKVLPDQLVDDAQFAARFEQEARVVGSLDHPNIIPLYRYGITEGLPWMALRYVDGGDFAARLTARALAARDGLSILKDVASALDYAHRRGVIHRDLKPQNILLTGDGAAYLADFGIAKILEGSSSLRTSTGGVLGTPPYMAPEQVQDFRLGGYTDVYALAVICFQWLAGRLPFDAETPHAILMKHVTEPVPAEALQCLPPQVAEVLLRGLAKLPELRYQAAGTMIADLGLALTASVPRTTGSCATPETQATPLPACQGDQRSNDALRAPSLNPRTAVAASTALARNWKWATLVALSIALAVGGYAYWPRRASPGADVAEMPADRTAPVAAAIPDIADDPSIAVLPFVNMSSDKEQEYFSDGMSEELLNLLAKVPQLRVVARTSSFSFKGRQTDIGEIARTLNVAAVLEGSVRKSGNTVRITVQLIRASDSTHLWSETYDRELDDIFKVQDEIAATVVDKLKITLLTGAPTARPIDPEAYQLILQAKFFADQSTAASRAQAAALYQRAVEVSPHEARAWEGLARVYINQAAFAERPAVEGYGLGREAAEKALANDPHAAMPHARLGRIAAEYERDFAAAARHYQRAVELEPANLNVLISAANFLTYLDRVDESAALLEYVTARDPANPVGHANLGIARYNAGRWDQSIASMRTALSLSPTLSGAHLNIGMALLGKGDAVGALKEIQAEPVELARQTGLPLVYHALGRKAESDAALEQLIVAHGDHQAAAIASLCAYRGEPERAFEWLDKAVATQDPGLSTITSGFLFTSLQHDPRWLPLLRRLGKAPEQLAAIEFKVSVPK